MTRMDWLRIALAPLVAVVLLAYAPSTLADEPGEEAMPEAALAEIRAMTGILSVTQVRV